MWSVLLFSHPRRKYLSFVLANSAPCTCFPLRLSPLRRSLLGHSSSGVSPEFHKSDCFSQKHLDRHSFIFFSSPLRLSLSTVFLLYLFIYFSFILSHWPTKEWVLALLLLALLPLALPWWIGLLRRPRGDSFHLGVSCAGLPLMVAR